MVQPPSILCLAGRSTVVMGMRTSLTPLARVPATFLPFGVSRRTAALSLGREAGRLFPPMKLSPGLKTSRWKLGARPWIRAFAVIGGVPTPFQFSV